MSGSENQWRFSCSLGCEIDGIIVEILLFSFSFYLDLLIDINVLRNQRLDSISIPTDNRVAQYPVHLKILCYQIQVTGYQCQNTTFSGFRPSLIASSISLAVTELVIYLSEVDSS